MLGYYRLRTFTPPRCLNAAAAAVLHAHRYQRSICYSCSLMWLPELDSTRHMPSLVDILHYYFHAYDYAASRRLTENEFASAHPQRQLSHASSPCASRQSTPATSQIIFAALLRPPHRRDGSRRRTVASPISREPLATASHVLSVYAFSRLLAVSPPPPPSLVGRGISVTAEHSFAAHFQYDDAIGTRRHFACFS